MIHLIQVKLRIYHSNYIVNQPHQTVIRALTAQHEVAEDIAKESCPTRRMSCSPMLQYSYLLDISLSVLSDSKEQHWNWNQIRRIHCCISWLVFIVWCNIASNFLMMQIRLQYKMKKKKTTFGKHICIIVFRPISDSRRTFLNLHTI